MPVPLAVAIVARGVCWCRRLRARRDLAPEAALSDVLRRYFEVTHMAPFDERARSAVDFYSTLSVPLREGIRAA